MIYKPNISRHPSVISRASLENDAKEDDYILKNFFSNMILNQFLAAYGDPISIQWIHLKNGGTVSLHKHDVDTLIIACRGKCNLTGEIESIFEEGDAVVIPKFVNHGLSCYGEEFFWGLSLRFN